MDKKKVKQKKPLAAWAEGLLKTTQHISVCVAVLACAGFILSSTIYVDELGYRGWLSADVRTGQTAGSYIIENLSRESEDAIRLAIIRSQLETDGEFDLKREINISDYYYRKDNYFLGNEVKQYTYFQDTVYYLEDLIRWKQSGGIEMLSSLAKNTTTRAKANDSTTEVIEVNVVQTPSQIVNRFLTVDGKRMEEIARTDEELQELLHQVSACMDDLYDNYNEYKYYMKRYKEGETSFVYYIDLDNGTGDIYTNAAHLQDVGTIRAQEYFAELECAAVGTTSLNFNIKGDYEVDTDSITDFMAHYDYAMGDNAVVYTGFDMSLGVNDYYATLWNAFDSYDADLVYILAGIVIGCCLYYFLTTIYMVSAAGRRVDKDGKEYLQLKWTDSAYMELFIAWLAALGFAIAIAAVCLQEYYMTSRRDMISQPDAMVICGITYVLSILFVESICSLSRRVKSGIFFKNSLFYKVVISAFLAVGRWIGRKLQTCKKHIQYYLERRTLWQKTWGIFWVEITFHAIWLSFACIAAENAVVLGISCILMGAVMLSAYRRLKHKQEREEIIEKIEGIVAGKGSRVSVEHLSAENAALGNAVNEIGDGIQQAVEKSVKDERLKAELLTNVSHDIKTPLTSIISYVDLLKKEQIENEKVLEYIEVLENKSLKLKNLIQDLIEVSKISTGNIEYEMMPLNLHELLMQAEGEYDERFAEHCLRLIYNNAAKEASIMADSRRMWRVMENLFSNVYKYALEGTRVYLEVVKEAGKLQLTMKNISAKELNISAEEISERFVRGDLSRTTEGSGLGLAIAQELVIGQGGDFRVFLDGDLFKIQIMFEVYDKS